MLEPAPCPQCGRALSLDAPGGLCIACLGRLAALGPAPGPEPAAEFGDGSDSRQVGDYQLISILGHGGMGVVWRARHLSLRREVALKLVRSGFEYGPILSRFETERQALARLDHPNIARVYDAGTTATGQPYFVMELIEGPTLTRYCDEQRLGIPARLELFVAICGALAHAHQKGLIHRDIKPGNVLVATQNGLPCPKVIDFGIAKAVDPIANETFATEAGSLLGTLEYMSPEQTGRDSSDLDTRSDIYALGILLYELLTSTTPLDRRTMQKIAWYELVRRIRDQDTPRPSTRLTQLGDRLADVSAFRDTAPTRLPRLLAGDLDWIVMKALEKDRGRRYESATHFAQDIRRHLFHEPVLAGPPTAAYRLRKFARKHALAVTVSAATAMFLIITAVGTTWLWQRSERQRVISESLNSRLTLNYAEQLLASDQAHQAVALLARGVRLNPHDPVLQARLLHLLDERTFLLPLPPGNATTSTSSGIAPPEIIEDPQRSFRVANSTNGQLRAAVQHSDEEAVIEVRNVLSKAIVHRWSTADAVVRQVDLSPNGEYLLAAATDRNVRLWRIGSTLPERVWPHPDSAHMAQFNPDGTLVATAGNDGFIRFWNPDSDSPARNPVNVGAAINSARFDSSGTELIITDTDGRVRIWSIPANAWRSEPGVREGKWRPMDATFLADGTIRVILQDPTGLLETRRFGRTAPFQFVRTRRPPPTYTASMSGRDLASDAFSQGSPDRMHRASVSNRVLRLFGGADGKSVCDPIECKTSINDVAFSADSRLVAVSCADRWARIWMSDGQPVTDWIRTPTKVLAVRFPPLRTNSEDLELALRAIDGEIFLLPVYARWVPAEPWIPELAESIAGIRLSLDRETIGVGALDSAGFLAKLAKLPKSRLHDWAARLLAGPEAQR